MTWVGYDIFTNVARKLIEVATKKEFLEELLTTTEKLLKHRRVGKRELRSYTGRANHVCEHGVGSQAVPGGIVGSS